ARDSVPVSKRAYDPALSGWGEKRVLVVVVDCAGTAGPAGISAGGAGAAPQPPPHGSDGARRRPPVRCAGFGPGIPCLSAWGAVNIQTSSKLVAKTPQQRLARRHVFVPFDALCMEAIHNAEDAAPLLGLGEDHLHRIGGCAVDAANL